MDHLALEPGEVCYKNNSDTNEDVPISDVGFLPITDPIIITPFDTEEKPFNLADIIQPVSDQTLVAPMLKFDYYHMDPIPEVQPVFPATNRSPSIPPLCTAVTSHQSPPSNVSEETDSLCSTLPEQHMTPVSEESDDIKPDILPSQPISPKRQHFEDQISQDDQQTVTVKMECYSDTEADGNIVPHPPEIHMYDHELSYSPEILVDGQELSYSHEILVDEQELSQSPEMQVCVGDEEHSYCSKTRGDCSKTRVDCELSHSTETVNANNNKFSCSSKTQKDDGIVKGDDYHDQTNCQCEKSDHTYTKFTHKSSMPKDCLFIEQSDIWGLSSSLPLTESGPTSATMISGYHETAPSDLTTDKNPTSKPVLIPINRDTAQTLKRSLPRSELSSIEYTAPAGITDTVIMSSKPPTPSVMTTPMKSAPVQRLTVLKANIPVHDGRKKLFVIVKPKEKRPIEATGSAVSTQCASPAKGQIQDSAATHSVSNIRPDRAIVLQNTISPVATSIAAPRWRVSNVASTKKKVNTTSSSSETGTESTSDGPKERVLVRRVMEKLTRPVCSDQSGKTYPPYKIITTDIKYNGEKCPSRVQTYECTVCSKMFYQPKLVIRHVKLHTQRRRGPKPKPPPRPSSYPCDKCPKVLKCLSGFKMHQIKHLGTRKNPPVGHCGICNKTFYDKNRLEFHKKNHTKSCKCEQCGEEFTDRYVLTRHITARHTSRRDHVCDICGKVFLGKRNLDRHMMVHLNLKPFKCSECDRSYREGTQLRKHVQKCHPKDEASHICEFCGLSHYSAWALHYHKKKHHQVKKNPEQSNPSTSPEVLDNTNKDT